MDLYFLEPEVSGGLGKETIFSDTSDDSIAKFKNIEFLHYEISGWMGDDLLESTPCFIVSSDLAKALLSSSLTGFQIKECLISTSAEFKELYPNVILPEFKWLVPSGSVNVEGENFGQWSGHDICASQRAELVVTKAALAVLRTRNLNYCDVTTLSPMQGDVLA